MRCFVCKIVFISTNPLKNNVLTIWTTKDVIVYSQEDISNLTELEKVVDDWAKKKGLEICHPMPLFKIEEVHSDYLGFPIEPDEKNAIFNLYESSYSVWQKVEVSFVCKGEDGGKSQKGTQTLMVPKEADLEKILATYYNAPDILSYQVKKIFSTPYRVII